MGPHSEAINDRGPGSKLKGLIQFCVVCIDTNYLLMQGKHFVLIPYVQLQLGSVYLMNNYDM